MGTLGTRTRNGKKAAPRRPESQERSHPAAAKLAAALREYKEAVEQQAATAEILRAMSGSPGNAQPVFKAIVEQAHRLCGAVYSILYRYDGEEMTVAAASRVSAPAARIAEKVYPATPRRDHIVGRAILTGRPLHSADLPNDARFPVHRNDAFSKVVRRRAVLAVPLLREGAVIGAISVGRAEARAFTKKEIWLLQTFADQAVIAIENVRLFNETKEALEQQTATAEVLRVISSSPDKLDPVFDAMLEHATRICDAHFGTLFLYRDDAFHAVTLRNVPAAFAALLRSGPRRPGPHTALGRVARTKSPAHIEDILADRAYAEGDPVRLSLAELGGARTLLAVPLLRKGDLLGVFAIFRQEVRPFTAKQIELVATFADQAVIAIENVRLFNETKESLERQTATSEILRVIAGSPDDVQPVFDTIVRNAVTLCNGMFANAFRYDGELLHFAATSVTNPEARKLLAEVYPMRPDKTQMSGRAVLAKAVVRMEDALSDPDYDRRHAQVGGWRRMLGMPMLREGNPIGAIVVAWAEPGPISKVQELLLQTFADQAVIAVENVRLFNETKEALEQQTAISEILRVISSSPTDVKPVLDAVAIRAARICDASNALMFLVEDNQLRHTAGFGDVPLTIKLGDSLPLDRGSATGRAVIDRVPVQFEDVSAVPREQLPVSRSIHDQSGLRTILAVPLLREQRALGAIALRRLEVRPFSEKQIALLKTFADQAAIAIENVRLFNETKEALDQQTSTAEVLKTISRSTFDLGSVLQTLLDNATRLSGAERAALLRPDADGNYVPTVTFNYPPDSPLIARMRERPIRPGRDSINGRVLLEKRPIHVPDVLADPEYGRQDLVGVGRFRTVLSVPMLRDGEAIGLIALVKGQEVDPFTDKQMEVVTTFADQAVIAIENVRLFREIEEKSAQLEVANKHKSDFLANMSHELRTPLNAIIGFSEALMERMFGEVNEKQADYLKDIHESGEHLLSLINDILDLSKIEAGRMDLELSSFHLPTALSNAMTLIRERAQRHAIELGLEVDERLGEFQADERKFKQIMLNLLSNAVKFTPDGGRVDVCVKKDTGKIEIAVKDTGIGIAPEDQAAVFEEFKQVGRDQMRKAEGTGLGLALTRRFVELHGGAIRLESTPGKGSTFTVSLPLRQ